MSFFRIARSFDEKGAVVYIRNHNFAFGYLIPKKSYTNALDKEVEDLALSMCNKLNDDGQNHKNAINYAKEVYTKLVMDGGEGPDLSEFEMTLNALSKGLDPKKYIEDAVKEIQKKG